MSHLPATPDVKQENKSSRGSALLLAVFVLVLLAGMGFVLLSLSQNEVEMSQSNLAAKSTFYLAEAGLENGRRTLSDLAASQDLTGSLIGAAGSDDDFDFDLSAVRPVKDGDGNVTGFTGYGDDVPLSGPVAMGDGMFISFLTNDPSDSANPDPRVDTNERVMITGIGAKRGDAMEIVQAIVVPDPLLPSIPPCTVMMLGPTPDFYGGDGSCGTTITTADETADATATATVTADETTSVVTSSIDKTFWGTDCAGTGGVAGLYVPTVCVQGCGDYYPADLEDTWDEDPDESDDELVEIDPMPCHDTLVELSIAGTCPNDYISGPYSGADTIADVKDPLNEPTMGASYVVDDRWLVCDSLLEIAEKAESMSSDSCTGSCDISAAGGWDGGSAPSTTAASVLFVDGDLTVGDGYTGSGLLWVTGTLSFHANASWNGPILVVGEGSFVRTGGAGTGVMSGASVVANTLGADGVYGTSDDCSDGFGIASFQEAVDSTGDTMYCTDDLNTSNPMFTYDVTSFKQN